MNLSTKATPHYLQKNSESIMLFYTFSGQSFREVLEPEIVGSVRLYLHPQPVYEKIWDPVECYTMITRFNEQITRINTNVTRLEGYGAW